MSRLIPLSFTPKMKKAILEGKKCCTTRVIRKDAKGRIITPRFEMTDQFIVEDRLYEIIGVQIRTIQDVYVSYLSMEGFRDTDEKTASQQFEEFFAKEMQLPKHKWENPVNVYFFAYVGVVRREDI
jgi:hypothetical protein